MRFCWLIVACVLTSSASTVSAAGSGTVTSAVVDRYLAAYAARDYEALRGFYVPESVFRDPTAAQAVAGARAVELRGPEAIVAHLAETHADTLDFRLEVEHAFVVGALVVVEGVVLRTRGAGQSAATPARGRRAVWILRVEDERVLEHTEYNAVAPPAPVVAPAAPVAPAPVAPAPSAPPPPVVPPPPAAAPAAPVAAPAVPAAVEGVALTLEQIRTLAVIPALTDGKLDDELTVLLSGQLREKKPRYELISERQVVAHFPDPNAFSSNADLELLLAAARRAGAQAILLVQASSYRAQSDYGNRLRLKIVEVGQGTVLWSGGGWGTGGVSWEAAKKRSVADAVRQIP